MRISFMGTPEEAVPPLVRLVRAGIEVAACITPPDAPSGRGQRPSEHPVKVAARSLGLEVVPARDVNSLTDRLRSLSLDALVVVAFGQILSPALLTLPRLGAFNLHFSLLPKYRGAAPVQRALMACEKITGVTIIAMSPEVDAGDILLQHPLPIHAEDNALTLKMKLAWLGADLLLKALVLAEAGTLPHLAQLASPTVPARKLKKDELLLHWDRSAEQIWGLVRAAAPLPGAYTHLGSKRLKVLHGRPLAIQSPDGLPGQILSLLPDGILVAAGEEAFLVQEVQPEGKRRMPAAEFIRGSSLSPGASFSAPPTQDDG